MLTIAFTLAGAAMLGYWFFLRNKVKATSNWPATRGRITSSKLESRKDVDGDVSEILYVTYDYAVAGDTLRGDRISFSGSGSGRSKQKLARYPTGAEVDVFYDPQKPASAVLERKLPGNVVMLPIAGACFIVVGILVRGA